MTRHFPEIPEFRDVRQDDDTGRWHAVHVRTGKPIEAATFSGLERMAAAVRVAAGLKSAGRTWPDGAPVTATQEAAFTRMADTARRARERLMARPTEAD